MRTPRHFTLINGRGDSLDITTSSSFFYEPEGLGLERDETYRQIGDRWVLVNSKPRQNKISGKVGLFGEDPYQAYFSLVQFTNNPPLTLIYQPNPAADPKKTYSGVAYRRSVRISRISKTEINEHGYLEITIELMCMTPWYKPVSALGEGDEESSETASNKFKWNIVWNVNGNAVKFGGDQDLTTGVYSDSYSDSPCRLVIWGPTVNPYWRHYVNGVLYETGKVNVTVNSDQYLLVDNTGDPYEIAVYNDRDEFIQNAYQNSDFSTERFLSLQHGSNVIRVTDDDNRTVSIKAEALIYYESV